MGLERKHARLGTSADSLVAQTAKNLPTVQETQVRSLGWENPLEKETATHCSILVWEIPWTEELRGLQSKGRRESDMTERLTRTVGKPLEQADTQGKEMRPDWVSLVDGC